MLQQIEESLLFSRMQGFIKILLRRERKKPFLDRSDGDISEHGLDDWPLYVWLSMWEQEQHLHILETVGMFHDSFIELIHDRRGPFQKSISRKICYHCLIG